MGLSETHAWLAAGATGVDRAALACYGIPTERAIGVPMARMLAWAKGRPKDQPLARALCADGRYEPRICATLIGDPAALTSAEMDAWVKDFDSWAICDTACFRPFDRTPFAWDKVADYAARDEEFVRRTAFALIWALSVHDKTAPDQRFLDALALCEAHAEDRRPTVRTAVSMPLRATGKRNAKLNAAARATAARLASGGKPAAATAREADREFALPALLKRLGATH